MIDQLIEKARYCIQNPSIWDKSLQGNNPLKKWIVEWDATGCWDISLDSITYTDCMAGHTYKITKSWLNNDWFLYQQLYLETEQTKEVKIEVPLEYQIINIDGTDWQYTHLMRPGNSYGNATLAYLNISNYIDAIDNYYSLLKSAIKIATNLNALKIPTISLGSYITDPGGSYFVKTYDKWRKVPKDVINFELTRLQIVLSTSEGASESTQQIMDHATTKINSLIG